jgi:hypothetical protein
MYVITILKVLLLFLVTLADEGIHVLYLLLDAEVLLAHLAEESTLTLRTYSVLRVEVRPLAVEWLL